MTGNPPLRVVLQHRNRLFREMLAECLAHEPGLVHVGSAPSGQELVQLCTLRGPAVAVFEADAPQWSHERLIAMLRQSGQRVRMIGVHEALPSTFILSARDAGVSALVSYASGLQALLDAIKSPPRSKRATRAKGDPEHTLTERELEVLYLIGVGFRPKAVALELGISLHTVENHKQRIFTKLDVHNQAHAAASAARLGLLPSSVPSPRQGSGPPTQCVKVGAVVRDASGRLADRVREVLAQQGILARDEEVDADSDLDTAVLILLDPDESDWAAYDGRDRLVVVTGEEPNHQAAGEALAQGVTILSVARIGELLAPAVRAASEGHVLVNSDYVQALLGRSRSGSNGGGQRWRLALTPRERDILVAISSGSTTKQTARQLEISVRTVENLQSNLFRKLRVHSRAAALVAAHDLRLLEDLPGAG